MAKRVAITIAGAVSLGSYEAGVTYELLEALRLHNEACDTAKTPDAKIYVDVITGASAGGMTAAMLAQRLMFDGAAMQDEFTNPLYDAWVKTIDIRQLVALIGKEKKLRWHSLLSSDLIESIGNRMLVQSMDASQVLSGPHSVVEVDVNGPVPIDVGLAITNLNGVDYMLAIPGSDEEGFNYTNSVDQRLFTLEQADRPDVAKWQDLRQAAVSSGAFPAAFRAQPIKRNSKDYKLPKRPPKGVPMEPGVTYLDWGGHDPETFAYCDGGVLQNQPLGIAKNFVNERVERAEASGDVDAYRISEDRLYVFVSPNAVKSTVEKGIRAGALTIVRELMELLHVYLRQATFHDWIKEEGENTKVRKLDERAQQLATVIAKGSVPDIPALEKAAEELNALLIPTKQTAAGVVAGPDRRDRTYQRLALQYADELTTIRSSATLSESDKAAGQQAFLRAIATLEAAAGLGDTDKMKIVAVIADGRRELAGSGLSAFVGFFSREFRDYDYWVGRVKTRKYLLRPDVMRILGITAWDASVEQRLKALPENRSNVHLPLSTWQKLRPGLWSLVRLFLLRWELVVVSAMILLLCVCGIIASGAWLWQHLAHHI